MQGADSMSTHQPIELLNAADALMSAMRMSAASSNDVWKFSSYKEYARKYNQLVDASAAYLAGVAIIDKYLLDAMSSKGNTLAMEQKEMFDSVYLNLSILRGLLASKSGIKAGAVADLRDFIQSNLRRAIFDVPDTENRVQDALESLFIGRGLAKGLDYDREVGRVKISVKEVVPDFILPKLNLAIELKLSRSKSASKTIIDEINADIRAYAKQYSQILFVVYDLSSIQDEAEFKRDLENGTDISVIVIKH